MDEPNWTITAGDRKFLTIFPVRRTLEAHADLDEVAYRFWDAVDNWLKENGDGATDLAMEHEGEEFIEVDAERRRIRHGLWDPEAAFVMSEIERRGVAQLGSAHRSGH